MDVGYIWGPGRRRRSSTLVARRRVGWRGVSVSVGCGGIGGMAWRGVAALVMLTGGVTVAE